MPTPAGKETRNERLASLRTDLARVRATIARAETNGASFNIGGTAVTQIAYERALAREKELRSEIAKLESIIAGSPARPGVALTQTRMP